jgi:hypothetical protein
LCYNQKCFPCSNYTVAPAQVSISGPTEARKGDSVTLTCTTANSNPPAEIKWLVAGRHIRNATSHTVVSPEGGWITMSNITTVVPQNKRSLVVICHGINVQLTENIVSTHTINVLRKCHYFTLLVFIWGNYLLYNCVIIRVFLFMHPILYSTSLCKYQQL